MPPENWGVRSIPEIDSRYPLWDQPDFERDVDEGRFYLPDAEELKRETLVTSVIDAKPVHSTQKGFTSHSPPRGDSPKAISKVGARSEGVCSDA